MRRRLARRWPGRPSAGVVVLSLTVLVAGCGSSSGPGPAGTAEEPTVTAPTSTTTDAAATATGTGPTGTGTTGGGTGTGGPAGQHAAGDVITPTDLPATLRLAPGEEATLRLPPPLQGLPPSADTTGVVELVPVDHLVDPGYAEYQLLAQAPGETTVTVGDADDHPEDVVLEVVVDG